MSDNLDYITATSTGVSGGEEFPPLQAYFNTHNVHIATCYGQL